jgi:hypothetical protein
MLKDKITISEEQRSYWTEQISFGPNAELYEKLLILKEEKNYFTDREFDLGINPLFFGLGYVDKYIERSVSAESFDLKFQWGNKEDREKRIEELIKGEFFLPTDGKDMLKNIKIVENFIMKRISEQDGGCLIMGSVVGVIYSPFLESFEKVKQKIEKLIEENDI